MRLVIRFLGTPVSARAAPKKIRHAADGATHAAGPARHAGANPEKVGMERWARMKATTGGHALLRTMAAL